MTQSALVKTGLSDQIMTITLSNPSARNSLSSEMMSALQTAFDAAGNDPAVRVVVLAAEGPAFCAGHDLKQMRANQNEAFAKALFSQCAALMLSIVRLPKPVIARVHATATAAGCQLVASCDLAIASTHARFATPGVNIGLFCHTPMVALSRNVANKHAMEMLLTGDLVSADDAMRIGLVNRVVEDHNLDTTVLDFALKIASKSSHTLKVGKEAFYRQAEMTVDDAYAYASEVMTQNLLARDAVEGIDAFVSKREPVWEDR
jgi:enoyl-CoA hydratase/carnithine racemase